MKPTKWEMTRVLHNLPELQKRANELRDELKAAVSDDNQALWLYIAHLEARDKYLKWWIKRRLDESLQNLCDTEEQLRANDRELKQQVRDCERAVVKSQDNSNAAGCIGVIAIFALALASMAFVMHLIDFDLSEITHSKPRTEAVESAAPEIDTTEPSAEPAAKPEEQPYKVEVLDQNTEV